MSLFLFLLLLHTNPCWYSLSFLLLSSLFLLHIGSVSGSASVFELQEKRTHSFFLPLILHHQVQISILKSPLFFIQSGCSGGSEHDAVLQTLGAGTGRTHTGDLALVLFNWQVWSNWVAAHTHTCCFSACWFCTVSLCSPLPQTAGEWAQVLQLQRQFHQAQMNKWQQILQSSVTLLDQVCAWAELKMSSSGRRNAAFAENKLEVIM